MNSIVGGLAGYFHTDWQAMTATDWFGTMLTVAVAIGMAVAYFQVFRPSNRESLESAKRIPFDDDSDHNGDHDGGQ